jgi:hypothetical protein
VLEERESAGGVTKNHRLYDYKFATEKQTGAASGLGVWRELLLMGFAGVIKSPSGREREFSIANEEVRSIEFK